MITDDKDIDESPDELEKKVMMEEWEAHMSNFVPEDMLTIELNPRDEVVSNIILEFSKYIFTVVS